MLGRLRIRRWILIAFTILVFLFCVYVIVRLIIEVVKYFKMPKRPPPSSHQPHSTHIFITVEQPKSVTAETSYTDNPDEMTKTKPMSKVPLKKRPMPQPIDQPDASTVGSTEASTTFGAPMKEKTDDPFSLKKLPARNTKRTEEVDLTKSTPNNPTLGASFTALDETMQTALGQEQPKNE